MKNLLMFSFLLLFAAMGCQTDLTTGLDDENLTLRGEKNMVPFHAEVDTWFDLAGGFSDCGIPGFQAPKRFVFEGKATHLGHVTGWGEGYACQFNPVTGDFHGDFTGAYIAANGDELWFEGWIETNLFTGMFLGSESEFTGGTGRWVDATGSITSTVQPTETPGVTLYTHDGEVSAPGKK